ncbi:hypothetical protein SAMN05421690_10203 [Nitrosomonas sp. Nm51]|nr:hypothetical protein SAMN05421690_10203 [Nitrosomonas sp. Nm51]
MGVEITRLDEKLSVTGQIGVDDLTEIAGSGWVVYRKNVAKRSVS